MSLRAKANNAVVAVTDFYSSLIAEYEQKIAKLTATVQMLSNQLRERAQAEVTIEKSSKTIGCGLCLSPDHHTINCTTLPPLPGGS